jgi:hypothetical protein
MLNTSKATFPTRRARVAAAGARARTSYASWRRSCSLAARPKRGIARGDRLSRALARTLCTLGLQPIPDARLGDEEPRARRIVLQLAPQMADVDVQVLLLLRVPPPSPAVTTACAFSGAA